MTEEERKKSRAFQREPFLGDKRQQDLNDLNSKRQFHSAGRKAFRAAKKAGDLKKMQEIDQAGKSMGIDVTSGIHNRNKSLKGIEKERSYLQEKIDKDSRSRSGTNSDNKNEDQRSSPSDSSAASSYNPTFNMVTGLPEGESVPVDLARPQDSDNPFVNNDFVSRMANRSNQSAEPEEGTAIPQARAWDQLGVITGTTGVRKATDLPNQTLKDFDNGAMIAPTPFDFSDGSSNINPFAKPASNLVNQMPRPNDLRTGVKPRIRSINEIRKPLRNWRPSFQSPLLNNKF